MTEKKKEKPVLGAGVYHPAHSRWRFTSMTMA